MRLLITTPTFVVIDVQHVVAVRAEDESGSFGILDGHADFLTALTVSVVSWHHADDRQRFCAVRRGVLRLAMETKLRLRHAKQSRAMISLVSNTWSWRNSTKRSKPSEPRAPKPCGCKCWQ